MRNTLLLLGSILVGLLLSELLLRIYNPIETRIRGERIILRTNTVYDMPNLVNPKLASRLVHTRNNIGFRGPDWPPAPDAITLFAVGGSTTEGFYLSDGNDWPAVTARYLSESHPIWMNNAGLDGHSTFGHTILLNDILHTYQPDYILYLIGANDVGRMDLNDHRQSGIASVQHALSSLNGMLTFMAHRSELAALVDNAIRGWRASRLGVTHL
ncbi:MAG: SGNH/GDSL hydrolase family protein, partial [Balneolales bacterium]|nr:SGNH/GDSL hydrolase family protein [Balneolales bacterium]